MPYFIYKIGGPFRLLEKQGQNDNYKEAKALAKELRRDLDPAAGQVVKIFFAENELAAEDVLSQPREAETAMIGDDY